MIAGEINLVVIEVLSAFHPHAHEVKNCLSDDQVGKRSRPFVAFPDKSFSFNC